MSTFCAIFPQWRVKVAQRESFCLCEKVTEEERRACYNKATKNKTPNQKQTEENLMKYVCDVCGWEYDEALGCPEKGIAPGTKWEDVHDDFECPLCFVGKDQFSEA